MQNPLTSTDQTWCEDLLLALRARDVPGAPIGEVLAEVQSHLAETGEDPREAFGTPKEYADRVAGALGITPVGVWGHLRRTERGDLFLAVVFGLSSYLLADALWSLGAGEEATLGLPTWVAVPVAVLLLAAGVTRLVSKVRRDPGDPVVDPRTGRDMVTFGPWRLALLAALPVVALAGMLLGGHLTR
ncbi:hypothetical protein [Modestobacter sp. URMC 112]